MMKHNLEQIMSGTFAILGVMCISSGIAMSQPETPKADIASQVTKLTVTQKRVANIKNNEILNVKWLADFFLNTSSVSFYHGRQSLWAQNPSPNTETEKTRDRTRITRARKPYTFFRVGGVKTRSKFVIFIIINYHISVHCIIIILKDD